MRLGRFCEHSSRRPEPLHERRFAPKFTGYQADLYSIERDFDIGPRRRTDRIEHEVFGSIDNAAAPVLRKLLQMAPSALNEAERHHWAVFVNSLIERHPQQMLAHFKAAMPVVAKVFADSSRTARTTAKSIGRPS